MKKLFLFILFSSGCIFFSYSQVYRWDVKILVDTAGHRIYKLKAEKTTIANLASNNSNPRPKPDELKKGKRADAEKRKVTITAYIMATGLEDDGDYHLVLKELKSNKTLIAEIPNPAGIKLKGFPGYKNDYAKARNTINEKIGTPPKAVTDLPKKIKVQITGIVFFDKTAHGHGHASNGVEIHPVLSIKIIN